MGKRLGLVLGWSLLLLVSLQGPAMAREEADGERILRFASHIQIHPDAALTVTETIVVQATGDQIEHGLVRDFPTVYDSFFSARVKVGFEVLEIRRDGAPEPYRVESVPKGKRIYLGRPDFFLAPGVYTYTIRYRTTRQLGFFPDFDELYWNVTGNAWTFPLDRVEAAVVLPPGAAVRQYTAYTGVTGARGQDFRAAIRDGRLVFTSTRSLPPGEGLTIAVAWAKGFVQVPTGMDRLGFVLEDNPGAILAALAVLGLLLYYLVVWFRVGRDPAKGLIIPLFQPPPGLSPAAVRLVTRMGFDDKAFAATLVHLAVKGWLVITGQKNDFVLRQPAEPPAAPPTPVEKQILAKLFREKNVLPLDAGHRENIKAAVEALKNRLGWEVEKKYFVTNSGRLGWGLALSLLALVLAILETGDRDRMLISGFLTLWLSVWTPVTISLWLGAGKGQKIFALPFAFFMVLAFIVLFAFAPLVGLILAVVVGLNMAFHTLLKAYTVSGRRLLDQIEGFRMYLAAAEQERLDTLQPPERTLGLFEKYLPFALALDVENEWCEQFADILARASYAPGWYQGSDWRHLGAEGFSASLGNSFSSSITTAASPPGSSSGSGGGGSSGGGGGGGGGSGW